MFPYTTILTPNKTLHTVPKDTKTGRGNWLAMSLKWYGKGIWTQLQQSYHRQQSPSDTKKQENFDNWYLVAEEAKVEKK